MKRNLTALVIGNGDYNEAGPLNNAVNDANDITIKLQRYGFDVIKITDATALQMDMGLLDFKDALAKNDVGLFFFAGHGMQIDGENFLIAIDSKIENEIEVKHSSLPLNKVLDYMHTAKAETRIIILDACRNNPLRRAWARSIAARGLASVYAPRGTIIAFATSPGETAKDGRGRNGTFTAAILEHIDAKKCSIETMFKRVRNTVAAETDNQQTTWEHTSLSGEFRFNMGIGELITEYKDTSLADAMFVLDKAEISHEIIRSLKSLNWYKQNPAINILDAKTMNDMEVESLFVLGRNIYQASCGSSKAAEVFIIQFPEKVNGVMPEKQKAMLDGMLFETFFDKDAELRVEIKGEMFDALFELEKLPAFESSFDFISGALANSNGDFYCLPGKGDSLAVAVTTELDKGCYNVYGIYVGSKNILRLENSEYTETDPAKRMYRRMTPHDFIDMLSLELIVPRRLLSINYNIQMPAGSYVGFPYGWTVKKAPI